MLVKTQRGHGELIITAGLRTKGTLDFLIQLSVCTESTPCHEKNHTVATTTDLMNCSTPELCKNIKNNSILRTNKRDLWHLHVALTNVTWRTDTGGQKTPATTIADTLEEHCFFFGSRNSYVTSRRTTLPDTHTQTVYKLKHIIRTLTLCYTSNLTSWAPSRLSGRDVKVNTPPPERASLVVLTHTDKATLRLR
jgi:hypothetical protein